MNILSGDRYSFTIASYNMAVTGEKDRRDVRGNRDTTYGCAAHDAAINVKCGELFGIDGRIFNAEADVRKLRT